LHTFTITLAIMDARTSLRWCKKWWSTGGLLPGSGRQQPQDSEEAQCCQEGCARDPDGMIWDVSDPMSSC
jgi:hypothetical protein